MIAKPLVAAAALAATLITVAPVQQAEAKTNFDVNIGIGGGYGYGGYGYGYRPYPPEPYYGYRAISCRRGASIVQWNGFRGVSPVDCSLPRYHYVGWRHGRQYMVTVSGGGAIVSVRPYW